MTTLESHLFVIIAEKHVLFFACGCHFAFKAKAFQAVKSSYQNCHKLLKISYHNCKKLSQISYHNCKSYRKISCQNCKSLSKISYHSVKVITD